MSIVLDFLLMFVEMSFVFEVSSESRIQQSIGVPEMSQKILFLLESVGYL